MSTLMHQRVDWSGWAAAAEPITCPACERDFQPNHPRRRYCGAEDCPGRTRRRTTPSAPRAARAPRRRRGQVRTEATALSGLFADATVELHRLSLSGTSEEVLTAVADLRRAIEHNASPATERALTIRLLAAAAARAPRITGTMRAQR